MSSESFLSHLLELRSRLLRSSIAFIVVFVCLFPFARKLYRFLALPMIRQLPHGSEMIATEVTTPFFVPIKVAMLASVVISLPYILYQLWAFVAPGLYTHEKRLIGPLVIASTVLFYCGMTFAYFAVFPVVFHFLANAAPAGVAVMTDISKYFDFVTTMFLAFGVTFEVPIIIVVLVRTGLVSVTKLRQSRPYAIVGAFVIGAIFTPPDVLSQSMLAIPLWLLFELGIIAASIFSSPPEPEAVQGELPLDDNQ
ncbi:MAG TPA: twin-arginine translocase subunit TatC [Burkholderiales bacterium]|nr:twin-arginine translocase subunit TatC [Burkholderiales bacterium]